MGIFSNFFDRFKAADFEISHNKKLVDEIKMSAKPNQTRGTQASSFPYSFSVK